MTTTTPAERFVPIDDAGGKIEPNPHFDKWDVTPHAFFHIGVAHVQLGDVVLGGTHQVAGIGQANQRGMEARRLDLDYIVAPSMEASARIIIPIDQLLEIKRYNVNVPNTWAYVKCHDDAERTYPAGLVPDYGTRSDRCGCAEVDGKTQDFNEDGFDASETMCNDCASSWALDHTVVRHARV